MSNIVGNISQIIGPVIDVHFDLNDSNEAVQLPRIHDALSIRRSDGKVLIAEVQQHVGEDVVRAVAMDSTDGLCRGMQVLNTGKPVSMPIGPQIRGRVMNVTGGAIDGLGELDKAEALPLSSSMPKANVP